MEGRNCKDYFGSLVDLAVILGKDLNMTIDTEKQVDGDWGVYPKSGSHDFNGEWGGAMGKVGQTHLQHHNIRIKHYYVN